MKFVTIDVTKEDIEKGSIPTRDVLDTEHFYDRAAACPVALAARRQFTDALFMHGFWLPGGVGGVRYGRMPLTQKASDWINNADSYHLGHEPFTKPEPIRLRLRYE